MNLELTESQSQFLDQVAKDLVRAGVTNPTREDMVAAMQWRLARNLEIMQSEEFAAARDAALTKLYYELRGE